MSVLENWQLVQHQIQQACQTSGRDAGEIKVVAVTKYVDIERMQEALTAGIKHLGESRIQDALPKWATLGSQGIWHFIGHLQTNKVRDVLDKFAFIHSLDRFSLATEINKRAEQRELSTSINCFVQVNIAGEETKHGLAPQEVEDFVAEITKLPYIKVVGLMTMAPYVDDPEEARPVFRQLKEMQASLQQKEWAHAPLTELSMGMSNDYQIAIEEGATYIRLGSCLVGK